MATTPLDRIIVTAGLDRFEGAGTRRHKTMSVRAALEREWLGDFYLTQYSVWRDGAPLATGWRLRKAHGGQFRAGLGVECGVRIADIDTCPKRALTADDRQRIARVMHRYPVCWYFTRNGFRILQPLTRRLSPDELETMLLRWLVELESVVDEIGIPDLRVDDSCKDWTRLFRMPRVVRMDLVNKVPRYTNLWATEVHGLDCPAVDPGDCTPPEKVWRAAAPRRVAEAATQYGRTVVDRECERLAAAREGAGTATLTSCAFRLGGLVGSGHLERCAVVDRLRDALAQRGYNADDYERTLQRCLTAGEGSPRGPDPTERIAGPVMNLDMQGCCVMDTFEARALKVQMSSIGKRYRYDFAGLRK